MERRIFHRPRCSCSIQITGLMREISGYRWLELESAIITLNALGARRQAGGFGFSHVKPGVDRRKPFLHLAEGWRILLPKEVEGEPE
jgi:hypothetical protein